MKQHRMHLMLCAGTGCVSNGSFRIQAAIERELAKHDLQEEVSVVMTGCNGFCAQGPVMVVHPDNIFYQLLHRTASAVIEAERFGTAQAVMLVHSFSTSNRWFEEYKAFVGLFGVIAEVGRLATVCAKDNMPLHLAWVHGDERFLNA